MVIIMSKQKMPSEYKKVSFSLSFPPEIAVQLKSMESGTRSSFVSDVLKEKLEELNRK